MVFLFCKCSVYRNGDILYINGGILQRPFFPVFVCVLIASASPLLQQCLCTSTSSCHCNNCCTFNFLYTCLVRINQQTSDRSCPWLLIIDAIFLVYLGAGNQSLFASVHPYMVDALSLQKTEWQRYEVTYV